jgi:hypothetical protein
LRLVEGLPIPGQKLVDTLVWVIGKPLQYISEPSAGINIVEFACLEDRIHGRGAAPTFVAAGERPVFSSSCDGADRSFRRVVGETDTSIVKETGEGGPSLQHVIHGLADFGLARRLPSLFAQECFEIVNERLNLFNPLGESFIRCETIELSFDSKNSIDPVHRFRLAELAC